MKRLLGIVAISALLTSAGVSIVGSAAGASGLSLTKATPICNRAVEADKAITAKQVAACKVASGIITTKCSHGPSVYEIAVPKESDALLRVGHKPRVYTEANLYESEATSLCGDPIDHSLSAPAPPMTKSQIHALFKRTTVPTTVPSSVAASSSCAQWVSANNALNAVPAGMTMAQAEAQIASLCSPSDLAAVLQASEPAEPAAGIQIAVKTLEGEACPSNPHTKLCP